MPTILVPRSPCHPPLAAIRGGIWAVVIVLAACGQRGPLVRAPVIDPVRSVGPLANDPSAPGRADDTGPTTATDCLIPGQSLDPARVPRDGTASLPPCDPTASSGTPASDSGSRDRRDGHDANAQPSVLNPYLLPSQPGLDPALR